MIIESPPVFGGIISAADLAGLREIVATLDGLSYRIVQGFPSTASADSGVPGRNPKHDLTGSGRMSWYGLLYRTGMTTLVVQGYVVRAGSETLQVRMDGVTFATISASGNFSVTTSVASGYADGDSLMIEIIKIGVTNGTGIYRIDTVYGAPIVTADTWPWTTPPSFNGEVFPSIVLNQMSLACIYLFRRIAAVPLPLSPNQQWVMGIGKVGSYELWRGTVTRYQAEDQLRVYATATTFQPQERLRVWLNGIMVATAPASGYWSPGTHGVALLVDLSSVTVGSRAEVMIDVEVATAIAGDTSGRGRYILDVVRTEHGTAGYPAATLPSPRAGGASAPILSRVTLANDLNTLVDILVAVKARLDGRPELWNRSLAIRRSYAMDDHQYTKFAKWYPYRGVRRADSLIVRGRGVTIGLAGLQRNVGNAAEGNEYDWTPIRSESITDAEKVETKTIYFDALPGLAVGSAYYVWGTAPIEYVAEVYTT